MRSLLLALAVTAAAAEWGREARIVSRPRQRGAASLGLRGGAGVEAIKVPEASQVQGASPPEVEVHNIAKFNNWDHRECCVGNAQQWRDYMDAFLKEPKADIPKKIHQIWIGPKAPPIIWCDSWRTKYRAQYPGWEYKLWTDRDVAQMKLRTQEYYDHEGMFQCKADLLRLEILWEEGGIYIDADMVCLMKDLQNVLDSAKDTGFFCGYEPDTKDKPYSVIGNSFIACTAKHPLVDMLIKYIKAIYPHKRPYHGVEWVTGPLAFTKCISHSQMPWFVPPQIWFYPKFHYVPNPDAINLAHFPDSYAFQFGYTCSGLEGWVANSINRITVDYFWVEKCPQLRDRNWPMGRVKELPAVTPAGPPEPIPKVIHQFAFTGQTPEQLKKTWYEDFCAANEGWTYKCHSWFPDMKGDYFGCSMYHPDPWAMGPLTFELFVLETLFKEGGYHVPIAVPWSEQASILGLADAGDKDAQTAQNSMTKSGDSFAVTPSLDPSKAGTPFCAASIAAGFVEQENLGIVGASAGSGQLLDKIKALLAKSETPVSCKEVYPRMLAPLDSQTAYMDSPGWSRFLGAAMIFDLNDSDQHERDAFYLASTFVVPAYGLPRKHFAALKGVHERFVAVTHPDFYRITSLQDAVPSFIIEMDEKHGAAGWHFICLAVQWNAGGDGPVLVQVTDAAMPGNARLLGFVANAGAGALLPDMPAPPQTYEDFVAVWQRMLQLAGSAASTGKSEGAEKVVVANGIRKWVFSENDPRANSAT